MHGASFESIALEESGPWGWRATVGMPGGGTSVIELAVDEAAHRYVARTLEGTYAGMEIWTELTELSSHKTAISVGFHIPNLPDGQADRFGEVLVGLYTRLWDEDEAMMIGRQQALGRLEPAMQRDSVPFGLLGPLERLRASLPMTLDMDGTPIRIAEVDGSLTAFITLCPHLLGPLGDAAIEDGCVRCPWHGYRFDLRTGCSADGRGLSLFPGPDVVIAEGGEVSLVWKG